MKNKFGSILLSVAIAFGLWLYVITAVSPGSKEPYYNIPVVLEGESVLAERGLMITNASSNSVSVVLSGNRTDLSRVNSGNITVKADLSKIYEPGNQIAINYSPTFPGSVPSNAFVVESKTPERLYYTVERRITKDVPVEIKWNGSAAEGFITDRENRVLDYPVINLSGPESVLEKISKAAIEVDLTDQRESISSSYHYTLEDEESNPVDAALVTTNVEEVHLDVKIYSVQDLTLTYTLVEGGGAGASNATITLSANTIRVSGSEAALAALGDEMVIGTINLAEITKNTTQTFAVTLPEGIRNLTGVTEVEAEIKLSGLSTKDLVLTAIQPVNLPEGTKADIITEKMAVTLRGPAAQIAKLTEKDITVSVDFTGAEIGTATYKATISFAEGFEGVGVLQAESISAELKQGR